MSVGAHAEFIVFADKIYNCKIIGKMCIYLACIHIHIFMKNGSTKFIIESEIIVIIICDVALLLGTAACVSLLPCSNAIFAILLSGVK